MDFEKEIFSDKIIHYNELINYGFIIKNQNYVYCKKIMDDMFEVKINISKNGKITGKVFETEFGDEYLGLRIVGESGKFVHQVQEEYKKILLDIAEKCCNKQYFYTKQANRIANWIIEQYNIKPTFPWKRLPGYGIFELSENKKIFATILNIQREADDKNSKNCEEINIRIKKDCIDEMLTKKGVYKSYYKTNEDWIAIVLDNTFSDEEIKNYIKKSYLLTITPNEWIVPANPQYFDIVDYLKNNNTTIWKQVKGAKKGDYVYIYLAKPYSAILYKCQITNINIPYNFENKSLKITKAMEIKVLKRYNGKEYTFSMLKEYGVNFFRGPVKMPTELRKKMNAN